MSPYYCYYVYYIIAIIIVTMYNSPKSYLGSNVE